jgi:hypothetical protein
LVPQRPQFVVLRTMSASQPLALLPSQLPKPAVHETMTHVLAAHPAVALASEHRVPHIPQLLGLFVRLTSQPLLAMPSQSAKPGLHRSI